MHVGILTVASESNRSGGIDQRRMVVILRYILS